MRSHALLRGSGAGLAAVIRVDTTVSFLTDRERPLDMTPLLPAPNAAYIWKRVFLKGKGHRA